MLKSSLCVSDVYILFKGTIEITRGPAAAHEAAKQLDERRE